jgi:general secretion pathway protein L
MSLADALSPTLNRLRLRYAQSPLPAFLDWWFRQLRSLLPPRWRAALETKDAELWLLIEGGRLQVSPGVAGGLQPVLEMPLGTPEALLADFESGLAEDLRNRRRILLLPPTQVLRRRLQLPAAARENLATVLGFELDRQTPFRAEQVFFDSRVLAHANDAKTVPVELGLVPREPLQEALASLGPLAGQLDAVDAVSGGARMGFNFLPPALRRRRGHRGLWINLALVAASVMFLLLAMSDLVDNRLAAVEALRADADSQREAAREVAALRKSLEEAVAGANFLAVRKGSAPSVIELLATLTEVLPDDTFLERLNLAGTTLTMTGQSGQAAQLIERLRAARGIREAALSGAIQPDARSGKDRFNITAQVGQHQPEVANGAASGG